MKILFMCEKQKCNFYFHYYDYYAITDGDDYENK